jgi:hypothetical protein
VTFIRSPLNNSTPATPMSDAFEDAALPFDEADSSAEAQTPAAPNTRLMVNKSKLPLRWLPSGAIMRLNIFAELAFFLLLWLAYGFVMQYLPESVHRLVRLAFSPWAIALVLLMGAWLITRFLASLTLRCTDLQGMAWATQQSADPYNHADTEEAVLDLLYGAKESIAKRARWITTLFCAISSYLIVSPFY